MNAPQFVIRSIRFFEREVMLRLPFRFGVVTLTQCPQVYVSVDVEFASGKVVQGCAAEMMVPKWFDKTKDLSNEDNFEQLRNSLRIARNAYLSDALPRSAWQYFSHYYSSIIKIGEQNRLNHLTSNYGPALIDRAVIDALCHFCGLSFDSAVNTNQIGLECTSLVELSDLKSFDINKFLGKLTSKPSIAARHTVGLLDSIDEESSDITRPRDDLPVTLKEIASRYRHQYYKIKLSGDLSSDIARLSQIAPIIDGVTLGVTLDGNEQFRDESSFLEFFNQFKETPALTSLFRKIIFIEQPLHRDIAMQANVSEIARHKPLLIDESDADLDTYLKATELGYTGVSSKSCKGIYKSLINAARTEQLNEVNIDKGISFFQSGEDLTMQVGVGVQQDLALVSLLGLDHVERNGHHYVNGMQGIADGEQSSFIRNHPNLYAKEQGVTRLQINNGSIDLSSLKKTGFATAVEGAGVDWNSFPHNY